MGQGGQRIVGVQPMVREPRRWRTTHGNRFGHTRVHHFADRLRQQARRGLEHQIVREAARVEDALAFECGPGVGEFEQVAPAHCLRQLGAEVAASDRRDAHQQQALGAERGEPLFEQVEHMGRRVESMGQQAAMFFECMANGFEQVQRVAADTLSQGGGNGRGIGSGERERFDQRLCLFRCERRNGDRDDVGALLQPLDAFDRDRARAARCEAETQRAERRPGQPFDPGVDTRIVGELQVVEHDAGQSRGVRGAQQFGCQRQRRTDRARRIGVRSACEHQQLSVHRARERCAPAFGQRLHEPHDGRERHRGVARPGPQHQHLGARLERGVEQAALAEPGFAGHEEQLAGGPGVGDRGRFGLAPDHSRRPQHRGRQRLAGGPGRCLRLLDGVQQRQRRRRRPGADFIFEQAFAIVEREQRGGAVAAQVMQPHDLAMRSFAQRVEAQQRLRDRQRTAQGTSVFEGTGLMFEVLAGGAEAALAPLAQPGVEFGCVVELGRSEQARGVRKVVLNAVGQAQHGATGQQLAALLLESVQALAQCAARQRRVAVGPQQGGEPGARRRAFDRKPGKQHRIARREWCAHAVGAGGMGQV